jgi:hypothetical protein
MMQLRKVFGLALGLGLLAACNDPSGTDGSARIRVLLTDAPSDYIESAEVHITRVYLQGGEDDDAPSVDLFNDPDNPLVYDLLELRDGITADLTGEIEVEPGTYRQLRLVVSNATVTLAEGYTFNGGGTEQTLTIPSGAQSGIKIQLSDEIEAEAGDLTTIIVDFDVDQNFVIQGNPETPAGINGILFTPSLHEKGRETTS